MTVHSYGRTKKEKDILNNKFEVEFDEHIKVITIPDDEKDMPRFQVYVNTEEYHKWRGR